MTFDGSRAVPAYSVDPSRDLAHFAGPPSAVAVRAPVTGAGKMETFSNGQTARYTYWGRVTAGACIHMGSDQYGNERYWCPTFGGVPDGSVMEFYCYVAGRLPATGDSGVGLYSEADGALTGIQTHGGQTLDYVCPSGYGVGAVGVP